MSISARGQREQPGRIRGARQRVYARAFWPAQATMRSGMLTNVIEILARSASRRMAEWHQAGYEIQDFACAPCASSQVRGLKSHPCRQTSAQESVQHPLTAAGAACVEAGRQRSVTEGGVQGSLARCLHDAGHSPEHLGLGEAIAHLVEEPPRRIVPVAQGFTLDFERCRHETSLGRPDKVIDFDLCVCVCVCVCVLLCLCMWVCGCGCAHASMYACMHTYIHVYSDIHTCTYKHIYRGICTHKHARTHTHTHTCISTLTVSSTPT